MKLLVFVVAASSAAPAIADEHCQVPRIIAPALHQTVNETRPIIRWSTVPGASKYRVVLTARKPEGGVLASIDTLVDGSAFVPPAALAVTTAQVTVAITAAAATDCGDTAAAQSDAVPAHRFYIDMRPVCRLPDAPRIETVQGRRLVDWTKVPSADRYEVLGYAAFDGRLLFTLETREPPFALPDRATESLAIAVRPRCGPVDGAPAYVLN